MNDTITQLRTSIGKRFRALFLVFFILNVGIRVAQYLMSDTLVLEWKSFHQTFLLSFLLAFSFASLKRHFYAFMDINVHVSIQKRLFPVLLFFSLLLAALVYRPFIVELFPDVNIPDSPWTEKASTKAIISALLIANTYLVVLLARINPFGSKPRKQLLIEVSIGVALLLILIWLISPYLLFYFQAVAFLAYAPRQRLEYEFPAKITAENSQNTARQFGTFLIKKHNKFFLRLIAIWFILFAASFVHFGVMGYIWWKVVLFGLLLAMGFASLTLGVIGEIYKIKLLDVARIKLLQKLPQDHPRFAEVKSGLQKLRPQDYSRQEVVIKGYGIFLKSLPRPKYNPVDSPFNFTKVGPGDQKEKTDTLEQSKDIVTQALQETLAEFTKAMQESGNIIPESPEEEMEEERQPEANIVSEESQEQTQEKEIVLILRDSIREAYRLCSETLEPVHLLMAILRNEEYQAVALLNELGVTVELLFPRLEEAAGYDGSEPDFDIDEIERSNETNATIAKAYHEIRLFPSDEVKSEHLLLALLRTEGSLPHTILSTFEINYQRVAKALEKKFNVLASEAMESSKKQNKNSGQMENPTDLKLTDHNLIKQVYADEIYNIASYLKAGLSVLVRCDKMIVSHLWKAVGEQGELELLSLQPGLTDATQNSYERTGLQYIMSLLRSRIHTLEKNQVLVVPHLDLLTGGSDYPSVEAREFTVSLYESMDKVVLAFLDISLEIPEVLASRFSVRKLINSVPKYVKIKHQDVPLLDCLISNAEKEYFDNFDPEDLYKHVSGMNPIRIRKALIYTIQEHSQNGLIQKDTLAESVRSFKAKASANFIVPDVTLEEIGGYTEVKMKLNKAINLIQGAYQLSNETLRKELIPKGFIFYGPPGTGKTLFAKAIANKLNANVMVVSGPETSDKYVGESERKLREIFAEARRNAPSVLVFDEFDAIASKRSESTDGGARANNSVVAQILTEMDGFRPEAPVLVIGTTNRLDIIDDALLRPSRFQPISIGLPDKEARKAIAEIHIGKFGLDISENLQELIAEGTVGFNGDEIRSIFREVYMGIYCETPIIPITPERLGNIVGRISQLKEQQLASERSSSATRIATGQAIDRDSMIILAE